MNLGDSRCCRPQVKQGGRYRVGSGEIEVDAIELSRSRR